MKTKSCPMPFQRFGPKQTPAPLKGFLWALFFLTLGSALSPLVFSLLALSLPGLSDGFVWQLITYPFCAHGPLSFGLLIGLAFVLYLTWSIGGLLIKRIGTAPFFRFFFVSAALIGGLTMICSLGFDVVRPLTGLSPLLYALLIAMLCFGADSDLLLFMMVPFRAKTLILSLMAFNVILDLGAQAWTFALANIFGALVGYLYALLVWDLRGPFVTFHPFDTAVAALGKGVRRALRMGESGRVRTARRYTPEQSAEDEAYLEGMLSKISQNGPDSLTIWERWKIRRVTKRRRGR